ncbi:uncharacterized protein LOC117582202 [Drosophila guanche]|uniref:Uncharacterized protein n=1 Tax=Drosophila guanche TaxID=7266 RepID=A0A3B0K254_DROGU|nr:uncharacterized protein LOC117582202 [Drosophila guanche]SPP80029.1 Hypothetical predicted protein [Drosophila guanche]
MDLESFRSKYSDITVTTVTPGGKKEEQKAKENDFKMSTEEEQPPRVEITRVSSGSGTAYGPSATSTPLNVSASSSTAGSSHRPNSSAPAGGFAHGRRSSTSNNRSAFGPSPLGPADGSGTRSQQQTAAALAYATEYKEVMAKLDYTKYMQAKLKKLSESQGQNNAGAGLKFGMKPENILTADVEPKGSIVDTFDNLVSVVEKIKTVVKPTSMGMRVASERLLHEIANARDVVKTGQKILKHEELDTSNTPPKE